ncbi:Cell number regulator 5 [Apostasia shenzhenica]|uniref:Cell number regulator 5 n=1 Tax=Apostasia shenzhenica TaxID=1088818 RepID=A0A2I0BGE6_9ASPA|nr:Cell number regulator 5 [Apostasia shenzhenica]
MGSLPDDLHRQEIEVEEPQIPRMKLGDYIPIYIPAIERELLKQSRNNQKQERFLDFLKARPTNEWFLKILRRNPAPGSSPSDPETGGHRGRRLRFRVPFVRKIRWWSLWKSFKNWMKSPEHIALFIWLLFVAAGLVMLFLVLTGILNGAIPSSSRRKRWAEIINQILNALFTIMALYEHPKLFHHLVLLLLWKNGEKDEVRKVYCKNGTPKPNDRAHMLFVVVVLHITCFSQYVLCGLYWGYTRTSRPDWAEDLSIGVGIAAPIFAGAYLLYSPLGRVYDGPQTEAESQPTPDDTEELDRRIIITSPEWIGGLFDCCDDSTVCCLSFFCTFCVFGWNMERLGFGNMFVHIITFFLLCVAPFWVFAIAALNVDDNTVKVILVATGGVLCVFGLLYGGFWRSEMRKKFKLPGNRLCFGISALTDYVQWLFCWSCSLAQEVRTANFYDIEEDGFYRNVTDEEGRQVLVPLPREGKLRLMEVYERSSSYPPRLGTMNLRVNGHGGDLDLPLNCFGRASSCPENPAMAAPRPPLIRLDEERLLRMAQV